MNRFVFIVPAFNAIETIQRCIFSVWFQTYPNWHMVILDDMSTDNTFELINDVVGMLDIKDRVTIVHNIEKKWEVGNILHGLDHCQPDDIICRLDADDWLCDCDVLSIVDSRYNQLGCTVLWTAHRWSFSNHNISGPLPKDAHPYSHPWVSSHLKTFRKHLVEGIPDENYRNHEGEYFRRIGDQAIYLPALHNAAGNWHYEPIVAYHYTIDMQPSTFQTGDAKYQKLEAKYLRSRGYVA